MAERKKSRKAQIKMFETMAVLIVFFFLLIFGVSFYFVLQRSSLNRQIERNAQLVSIQVSQKISDLPELDCALAGIQIDNCIDRIKMEKLKEDLESDAKKLVYFNVLGYSEVYVRVIHPQPSQPEPYMIYSRIPSSFMSAYKNNIPVLLYDPASRRFSFAVLEVTSYAL